MLVTDRHRTRGRDLAEAVVQAVAGGVEIVQIREKDLPERELRRLVEAIRGEVPAGTRLVVNGRPALARTARLGLHLPAAAPTPARREGIALYGRSAHDEAEVRAAVAERVAYLVVGAVFATASKPGHPGMGIATLRDLVRVASPVPVYAIGGVDLPRIPELIHAGAHGVAVCGAILGSSDPRRMAEALCLALEVASSNPPGPR